MLPERWDAVRPSAGDLLELFVKNKKELLCSVYVVLSDKSLPKGLRSCDNILLLIDV